MTNIWEYQKSAEVLVDIYSLLWKNLVDTLRFSKMQVAAFFLIRINDWYASKELAKYMATDKLNL